MFQQMKRRPEQVYLEVSLIKVLDELILHLQELLSEQGTFSSKDYGEHAG